MTSLRVEAVVENDGELRLTNLPCHKGDRVEAVLILHQDAEEDQRSKAKKEFLAMAQRSTFRSAAPYPSREDLHEHH
ncbi:MAG: hypothetical protein JXB10_17960 [Pirellulales bacterium]|nr:hypothetical protein [Pirellulales bacterium]